MGFRNLSAGPRSPGKCARNEGASEPLLLWGRAPGGAPGFRASPGAVPVNGPKRYIGALPHQPLDRDASTVDERSPLSHRSVLSSRGPEPRGAGRGRVGHRSGAAASP